MSAYLSPFQYSFSMVNLVKLMQKWDWDQFDKIMELAGTSHVELVPGMLLGSGWDRQPDQAFACTTALQRLKDTYKVSSIQSLTYGLNVNLFGDLSSDHEVLQRFRSLACLGRLLNCKTFVLGSPGQKKLISLNVDPGRSKEQFVKNCALMSSVLGHDSILSLEHNTIAQGAETCNTLRDMVDVISELKHLGIRNVCLNLDTKCLLDEFGIDVNISQLINRYELRTNVSSIQVSFDFLSRLGCQARSDEAALLELARDLCCPLSLEEFGLLDDQLGEFIGSWQAVLNTNSCSSQA
jgi:hypothetical protein